MSGNWQNRMGTIRVSAMIVVLLVVGIIFAAAAVATATGKENRRSLCRFFGCASEGNVVVRDFGTSELLVLRGGSLIERACVGARTAAATLALAPA
jgi:hypothetical protein